MTHKATLSIVLLLLITLLGSCVPAFASQESLLDADGKLWPEPVTLTYVRPLWEKPPESEPQQRHRQYILDKTNINIEFNGYMYHDGSASSPNPDQDHLSRLLASGEKFDLLYYQGGLTNLQFLVDQEVIIPLDDLIAKYGAEYLAMSDPEVRKFGQLDGVQWTIPGETMRNVHAIVYRGDWLDAQGLSVPTTVEEFEHVSQVFKDVYGHVGFSCVWDSAFEVVFEGSFGPPTGGRWLDGDRLREPHEHPGYKDYLATMAEWYKKGYLRQDLANTTETWAGFMENNTVGIMHMWMDVNGITATMQDFFEDESVYAVLGPPLKSATWDTPAYQSGDGYEACIAISADCENPEAAFKYIMWTLTTREGRLISSSGVDGQDYLIVGTDDQGRYILASEDEDDPQGRERLPEEQRADSQTFDTVWIRELRYNNAVSSRIRPHSDVPWAVTMESFPMYDRPDAGFIYNTAAYESYPLMADLNAKLLESKYNIILGTKDIDSWDAALEEWYRGGGEQYLDELNAEYNAQKDGQ